MIITDVYLAPESTGAPSAERARLPGIEYAARFGQRAVLVHGWRDWLARYLGREDLAALAPARVAAALLAPGAGSDWIASPLRLSAALTRVHLDHRGLLRLTAEELTARAMSFGRTFAGSGLTLHPLPSGQFLLRAAGIAPVASLEPARFAGGEVPALRSAGLQAAALRRTTSEIEMWLHAEGLVEASTGAGGLSANSLWLWGASGTDGDLARRHAAQPALGFGADPYLDGLWYLEGAQCAPVPGSLGTALGAGARRTVLTLSVATELQESMSSTFTEALARLDARFITPALAALHQGTLAGVTLIANDVALSVRRGSGLKLWRRPRAGLSSLA